jgi:hypothetical protein
MFDKKLHPNQENIRLMICLFGAFTTFEKWTGKNAGEIAFL